MRLKHILVIGVVAMGIAVATILIFADWKQAIANETLIECESNGLVLSFDGRGRVGIMLDCKGDRFFMEKDSVNLGDALFRTRFECSRILFYNPIFRTMIGKCTAKPRTLPGAFFGLDFL
ncbi:hypothetical protein HYW59_05020 [Candidatus Kaiserbacteria bacterium]|nr:hypothetical protein [Candidatus Kaiserbacteria bacterium]